MTQETKSALLIGFIFIMIVLVVVVDGITVRQQTKDLSIPQSHAKQPPIQ